MRLLILSAFLHSGSILDAATLTVTSLADSGPGSLRDALASASPGDAIDFGVQGTITLTNGTSGGSALAIEKNIQINGPGAANLTIEVPADAPPFMSVFNINSNVVASMADLTITGDRLGGVNNYGTLALTNCAIANCTVFDLAVYAGGIFSLGDLSLTKCIITNCSTPLASGGILCCGPLTLRQCTIASNLSGGQGGGIEAIQARVVIDSCTISGNHAVGDYGGAKGGGICLFECTLMMTNSTVSGNLADAYYDASGGGIYASDSSLQLESCTIVSNYAYNSWGTPWPNPVPSPNVGGGILFTTSSSTSTAVFESGNSIFAGNVSTISQSSPVGSDCTGDMLSLGYNLIQDTNSSTITGDTTGNIYGRDPLLGPLQDNGGPTLTHALLPGSPAINAGSPLNFPPTDQRGFPRFQDGDGNGSTADIGAFEVREPGHVTFIVKSLADSGPGTLRNAVTFAQAGDTITFDAQGIILLTSGKLAISNNVQIIGPGASQLTIDAQGLSPVFFVATNATVSISDLTVTHGIATEAWEGFYYRVGAGVQNFGNLTMTRCIVTGCEASDEGAGGGIFTVNSLVLRQCSISGNGAEQGGGICDDGNGLLLLDSCAVCRNIVGGPGGGFGGGISKVGGTLLMTNSTISGNDSNEGFGGLFVPPETVIESCTIVSNLSTFVVAGIAGASFKCRNTIIAGNFTYDTFKGFDVSGTLISEGCNLVQDTNGCTITGNITGNLYGKDPLLGPLQDNGGPTFTHALLPSSPAIDAGSPTDFPATDQRGFSRAQDGNGDGVAIPDIGAFEKETLLVSIKSITVQNDVRLTASGAPGQLYAVQSTESLSPPQWVTLPAITAEPSGLLNFIDARERSQKARYYRIIRVSSQ